MEGRGVEGGVVKGRGGAAVEGRGSQGEEAGGRPGGQAGSNRCYCPQCIAYCLNMIYSN